MANDVAVTTGKSMFKHPERFLSVLVIGSLLVAAGIFIFPWITLALTNTIWMMIMFAIFAFLGIILVNKRLWASVFVFSDIISKRALGIVIQMDKFIIAENNIKKMEERRDFFGEESKKVTKQGEALNMKINSKMAEIEKLNDRAIAAKNNNLAQDAAIALNKKELVEKSIETLIPLRNGLTGLREKCQVIYKDIDYKIQIKKNELEEKKDLFATASAGQKALSAAWKALKGDPDENAMAEMAMDALNDSIANDLASMKDDYAKITDITKDIQLDNAAAEIRGLKKLENLELNSIDMKNLKARTKEPVQLKIHVAGKIDQTHEGLLDD